MKDVFYIFSDIISTCISVQQSFDYYLYTIEQAQACNFKTATAFIDAPIIHSTFNHLDINENNI